jgi:two-component system sensor histidine kinase QseC
MNLLEKSTRWFILSLALIALFWMGGFYFFLKYSINRNHDNQLENQKGLLINKYLADRAAIQGFDYLENSFKIEKVDILKYSTFIDKFSDTLLREPYNGKMAPFRQYQTKFRIPQENEHYLLTIYKPKVNDSDLFNSVFIGVIMLLTFTVLILWFLNKRLLSKIWAPFYHTLSQLQDFELTRNASLELQDTDIKEFAELNAAVISLTQKSKRAFESQKHFIENAAHEIQTPLAVIKNKIELAFQNTQLGEKELKILLGINEAANKLSKMNKTLQLISRIENNQYVEKEEIDLSRLIRVNIGFFEDKILTKGIKIIQNIEQDVRLLNNKLMIEILINNLIKNAVYHNIDEGFVQIDLTPNKLVISNSGEKMSDEKVDLLKRYNSGRVKAESTGLGLSIIAKICEVNNFEVKQHFEGNIYQMEVNFA